MVLGMTLILRSWPWQLGQGHRSLIGDAMVGILASAAWMAIRAQSIPKIVRYPLLQDLPCS